MSPVVPQLPPPAPSPQPAAAPLKRSSLAIEDLSIVTADPAGSGSVALKMGDVDTKLKNVGIIGFDTAVDQKAGSFTAENSLMAGPGTRIHGDKK